VQHGGQLVIEPESASAIQSLLLHWPEYLMEAAEVGLYLCLTCVFAGLLLSPASSVRHFIGSTLELRARMGLAVGATVVAIVLSPWGKQSGGHFNPALTVAFYRLGKICLADAVFYIVAQFSGAIGGVCVARYLLPLGRPAIRYALTTPGVRGSAVAFIAEVTVSFALMTTILVSSNRESLNPVVRDFHNPRSGAFRHEYESCQNLWTSVAFGLLACHLALFHCANSGDAHCRGGIPPSEGRSLSLLRKASPRQQ